MSDARREIWGGKVDAYGRLINDRPSTAEVLAEHEDNLARLRDGTYEPPPWLSREEAIAHEEDQIKNLRKVV